MKFHSARRVARLRQSSSTLVSPRLSSSSSSSSSRVGAVTSYVIEATDRGEWRVGGGKGGARAVGNEVGEGRTAGATSGAGGRGPKCLALWVALLSKMASSSELLEYSSPVKRRRVDGDGGHGSISAGLADPRPGETTRDSPHDDPEGIPSTDGRPRPRYPRVKPRKFRGCLARKMAALGRPFPFVSAFRVSRRGRHDSRDRSRRCAT